MSDEKVLLTAEEVAKLLDVSARHLRRLADKNEFPQPVRLGGCVRWHRATVEQFLRSLAIGAEAK